MPKRKQKWYLIARIEDVGRYRRHDDLIRGEVELLKMGFSDMDRRDLKIDIGISFSLPVGVDRPQRKSAGIIVRVFFFRARDLVRYRY